MMYDAVSRKLEIIQRTRAEKRKERYLNVKDIIDTEYISDIFGGLLEERFPSTLKRYKNTEEVFKKRGIYAVAGDTFLDGWSDAIFLKDVVFDEISCHIRGGIALVDYVYQITLSLDLYTVGENISIIQEGTPFFAYAGERNAQAELTVTRDKIPDKAVGILITACWVGQDDILKTKTKVVEWDTIVTSYEMLSKVSVEHPAYQPQCTHEENSPIIICYDRMPAEEDSYDYMISFYDGGFYIPSKGTAVFKDKNTEFDKALTIEESSSCLMIAQCDGGGAVFFESDAGKDFTDFFSMYIDPETLKPGFQWDFGKVSWVNRNPLPAMENLKVNYKLTVEYRIKNSEEHYLLNIYSDGGSSLSEQKTIPYLKIYWGCLYKDSLITMADGTYKKIQEIVREDRVMSPNGILRVKNLVTGTERKGIYGLVTKRADGTERIVRITSEHPLVTDCGIVPLVKLQTYINNEGKVAYEEKIAAEDGNYEEILRITLEAVTDNTVYNLELMAEDGTEILPETAIFYANGIAVGDNNMQQYSMHLQYEKKKKMYGLSEEWRKDVETAKREYKMSLGSEILWKN